MFSPFSAINSASDTLPSPLNRSRTRTKSAFAGDVATLFSSSSPLLLSLGFAPPSPSRYTTSTYTAHYTNNNNVEATTARNIRTTTAVATAGESPQIHLTPTFSSGFSPRIGGPAAGGASPRYRKVGGSVGGFAGGGSGLGVFGQGGSASGSWGEKQHQHLPPPSDDPIYELNLHSHRNHHHPLAQTVLTYNDPDLLADASLPITISSSSSSGGASHNSLSFLLATISSSSSQAFEDEYEHHPPHTQALHHPLSISYLGRKHARTLNNAKDHGGSRERELHLLASPTFDSFKALPRFSNRAFDAVVFLLFWISFVVFLSALFGVGAPNGEFGGEIAGGRAVGVGLAGLRMMPVKATSWSGASLSRELVNAGGDQVQMAAFGGGMAGLGGGAMRRFEPSPVVEERKQGNSNSKRKMFFGKFAVGPRAYGWEEARR